MKIIHMYWNNVNGVLLPLQWHNLYVVYSPLTLSFCLSLSLSHIYMSLPLSVSLSFCPPLSLLICLRMTIKPDPYWEGISNSVPWLNRCSTIKKLGLWMRFKHVSPPSLFLALFFPLYLHVCEWAQLHVLSGHLYFVNLLLSFPRLPLTCSFFLFLFSV